jgi:hypothetical protein
VGMEFAAASTSYPSGEFTVVRKSAREIGAAVQTCIDQFYHTRAPDISLSVTLDVLRQIGWPPTDIWRVERIACKVLGVTSGGQPEWKAA